MKILGSYPSTRLRRVRNSAWIRRLTSEHDLTVNDLIQPIFVREGKNKVERIKSMPGVFRYSLDKIDSILKKINSYKIPVVAIFPQIPNNKKDANGSEALNKNNLVCRTVKKIKKKYPKLGIMTDVALDPYTNHGHDGIISNGKINNDETIKILIKQAILQSKVGSDIIAPSDMMDGRIGKIRRSLEKESLKDIIILSYAVKYASNFYGPFRDAIGSKKKLKGDKKTYQMNYKNSNEALREVGYDINEGADIVMVKPGLPYLDIIRSIKDNFKIPIIAYQVSGEYSLLKNGIKNKNINEEAIIESLISFKRSGASAIVTYFAIDIAKKLNKAI